MGHERLGYKSVQRSLHQNCRRRDCSESVIPGLSPVHALLRQILFPKARSTPLHICSYQDGHFSPLYFSVQHKVFSVLLFLRGLFSTLPWPRFFFVGNRLFLPGFDSCCASSRFFDPISLRHRGVVSPLFLFVCSQGIAPAVGFCVWFLFSAPQRVFPLAFGPFFTFLRPQLN